MKDVEVDDNAFKPIIAMIQSMTPLERANPDLIVGNRRKRIAAGSGKSIQDVNNLLKQFEEMRKMMKKVSGMSGKMPGIMR
jgi:signal recognition particle subunit SRP54